MGDTRISRASDPVGVAFAILNLEEITGSEKELSAMIDTLILKVKYHCPDVQGTKRLT